jgi:phosphoribosylformylglycinamidine cyclo-ligase
VETIIYKDAGVDIELGDESSRIMYEASRFTWQNRSDPLGKIESETNFFGSLRYVGIFEDPELVLGMNSDGVGTKMELAERLGDHRTIAFDLFAMVCDDAAVRGAEPVLVSSVLDFNSVDVNVVQQLAEGMIKAAKESRVCVINGEIAELGERVGGYGRTSYNWSATALWAAKKSRLHSHKAITPGTKIIAVKEDGIRSNGLSLVRHIMSKTYGDEWHVNPECTDILKWALSPSRIYTPLLVRLHGGYKDEPSTEIVGAVHVTGGGIPGKLGRVLSQSRLGAKIDNLFPPSEQLLLLQRLGNVPDDECYKTWNMGQGLLILCQNHELIQKIAQESGFNTQLAGEVTDMPGIVIKSKAGKNHEEFLKFMPS